MALRQMHERWCFVCSVIFKGAKGSRPTLQEGWASPLRRGGSGASGVACDAGGIYPAVQVHRGPDPAVLPRSPAIPWLHHRKSPRVFLWHCKVALKTRVDYEWGDIEIDMLSNKYTWDIPACYSGTQNMVFIFKLKDWTLLQDQMVFWLRIF